MAFPKMSAKIYLPSAVPAISGQAAVVYCHLKTVGLLNLTQEVLREQVFQMDDSSAGSAPGMQMAMAGLSLRGALIKQTICIVLAKGNQTAISGHPVQSSVYRSPVYRLILFSHVPEQCPDVKGLFRMPLYVVFNNLNSL